MIINFLIRGESFNTFNIYIYIFNRVHNVKLLGITLIITKKFNSFELLLDLFEHEPRNFVCES